MYFLVFASIYFYGYSITRGSAFDIHVCSPTRPNPGGGGETCAETGINIFFSKVLCTLMIKIVT